MTPSEIADWLDAYQERINTSTRTFAKAAATIRAQSEALKISTEALEPLGNMATVVGNGGDDSVYVGQSGHRLTYGDFRRAAQALALIAENERLKGKNKELQAKLIDVTERGHDYVGGFYEAVALLRDWDKVEVDGVTGSVVECETYDFLSRIDTKVSE